MQFLLLQTLFYSIFHCRQLFILWSPGAMNVSTPGVVERASKEISRRIHSLGFKSSKRNKSVDEGSSSESGTGSSSVEHSDQIKTGNTDRKKKTKTEEEKQAAAAISESDR